MRNKHIRIFSLAVLLLFPLAGTAAETLEALQAKLSAHATVRGSFEQKRTLEMFKQPLVSEGRFLLSEAYGLQWMQEQPFSVSLILGADRLSQQFADQPAKVMAAEDNPMMFHFSRLFLSIFRGETEGLHEQFKVTFSGGEHWTLQLVPKKEPLSAAFKSIQLKGGTYINEIRLEETGGDLSEIRLSGHQTQPEKLTEKEQRAFEF